MDRLAPRRIRRLPPELANQIAAGEVVERPASVLKELLENSIDAGATEIEVEVQRGGLALIRVRDNGCGIAREDLPLATSAHATSKIVSSDELGRVLSLGFRGEALASIASVSRLTLTSRNVDDGQGWRISGDEIAPAAHPRGTTVEVCDLFYNTPARRKFLRSESTEFGHIEQLFRRLALSRFDVAFSLVHNRRQVLRLRAGEAAAGSERRVRDVAGKKFMETAAAVEFEAAGLHLRGWIAAPEASRSQADLQYFYINGRLVRDRLVGHALRQAHRDLLPEGRHPAYCLYLTLDAEQVDVNVHPTKHEVRFRESRLVHDFLFRAVREALQPEPVAGRSEAPVREELPDWRPPPLRRTPVPQPHAVKEAACGYSLRVRSHVPEQRQAASPGVAAVLFGRYILIEQGGSSALVDAVAARRLLAKQRLEASRSDGGIRSQPLLVPETVALDRDGVERMGSATDWLARWGFDLSPIGEDALMVRQLPAPLREVRPQALVAALSNCLAEGAQPEQVLSRLAECAGSDPVRPLDRRGAEWLVAELNRLGGAPACRVELSAESLGRLFADA